MTKLVQYDAARKALASATRVDEVKSIRDKAVAMVVYAKQAKDSDLIAHATAIRKRAERRLGELMEADRKAGKLAKGGGGKHGRKRVADKPTLIKQGIDKNLADRARKTAAMSEEKFERQVSKAVKVAVAATEGDAAVVKAARKEQQDEKRARRTSREVELATKITALPDRRYGVILADPEWQFEPWSRKTGMDRAAANHYPTSCTAVIAERDVPSIAAKDCALFLCATAPMLPHAMLVMAAWGFDYVTNWELHKDRVITGYWNRNRHEHLLLGVRGKVPCPSPGDQWDSVIEMKVGRHSAKPVEICEMIEAYFPNLPKIELNRRGPPRKGWAAWGNEVMEAAE